MAYFQRTMEDVKVTVKTEDENDNPIIKDVVIEYSSVDTYEDIERKVTKALGTGYFRIKGMTRVSTLKRMTVEFFRDNSELVSVEEVEYKPEHRAAKKSK